MVKTIIIAEMSKRVLGTRDSPVHKKLFSPLSLEEDESDREDHEMDTEENPVFLTNLSDFNSSQDLFKNSQSSVDSFQLQQFNISTCSTNF